MAVFIWGGRTLVGFGASFMIPSVLGLVPKIYHGKNRVLAFGCIGAASGLSALLPLLLSIVLMSFGMRVTLLRARGLLRHRVPALLQAPRDRAERR